MTQSTQSPTIAPICIGSKVGQIQSDCVYAPSVPVAAAWKPATVCEIVDDEFASKLADQLDETLGCSVWFIRRTPHGRTSESIASRSAKALMLSHETLSTIANDTAQSSVPIGINCDPRLPVSPSAILNCLATTHPYHAAISACYEMSSVHGSWVVILAWRHTENRQESLSIAASLDLYGPTIGKSLEAFALAKAGRKYLGLIGKLHGWRSLRKRWMLAGIVAFATFLSIPVPYRPSRDCILEPTTRRFVSSPIEGRLTSISVRPGEEVVEGQLLASIDEQPIRRELMIAEAELQSANKRRDVALATRASGDLRLAQLECQQIQLKIDSMREQLGRLEIHSLSSGVIVQGDWFGNEGMPVTLGQSLFEIASLDRMTAEVHLTADDLPWVKTGSQAVLRTDATGIQSWPSLLKRIEPRAEIIDDKAVYIAEMEIENSSSLFRPGMKGKAVVDTGNHSIGWLLLNKPYRWFVNMWVW